jgi:hypothetical protein
VAGPRFARIFICLVEIWNESKALHLCQCSRETRTVLPLAWFRLLKR